MSDDTRDWMIEALRELEKGGLPRSSVQARRFGKSLMEAIESMTPEQRAAWIVVMDFVMPSMLQLVQRIHELEARLATLEAKER